MSTVLKQCVLLLGLCALVLLVHYTALAFSMVYFEQPSIYLANQQLNTWADVLNVYLHPQMFYSGSVDYFRPSGHFLVYPLLAPWLGWHNIKGFIVVNLLFLGGIGWMMVRLYQVLFPRWTLGGYIAFAVYMMHPALILSHLMTMHFDYAYVFFSLLSIYYFVLFCQSNFQVYQYQCYGNLHGVQQKLQIQWRNFWQLGVSLFFFAIAITFKETALQTGVILIAYFLILFQPMQVWRNERARQIFWLLIFTGMGFFLYLSVDKLPELNSASWLYKLYYNGSYYLPVIFGFWFNSGTFDWVHRNIIFTIEARAILWLLLLLTLIALNKYDARQQKSVWFLLAAIGINLVMPVCLGRWPWHLSLCIVFLSLLMGFATQTICQKYLPLRRAKLLMSACAGLIALSTITMLSAYLSDKTGDDYFAIQLNHNAILHPPSIKEQLHPHSVLIVADSMPVGGYLLGDSYYRFTDTKSLLHKRENYFLQPQTIYNGTLFRWAYLLPELREEVYPFNLDKMQYIPDNVLKDWLMNIKDIHCLGYDRKANWHDLTEQFRRNLLREQARRRLPL